MSTPAGRFSSYDDFWLYYLAAHSRPLNRVLHVVGLAGGIGLVAVAAATGWWGLLIAAFVVGYSFSWFGHFVIERNKPATFGYPGWSFVSSFRMLAIMATGRIGSELSRAAKRG